MLIDDSWSNKNSMSGFYDCLFLLKNQCSHNFWISPFSKTPRNESNQNWNKLINYNIVIQYAYVSLYVLYYDVVPWNE